MPCSIDLVKAMAQLIAIVDKLKAEEPDMHYSEYGNRSTLRALWEAQQGDRMASQRRHDSLIGTLGRVAFPSTPSALAADHRSDPPSGKATPRLVVKSHPAFPDLFPEDTVFHHQILDHVLLR